MKILTVVSARPNFMKAALIIAAAKQHNLKTSAMSADSASS
jgi:UDP-N-acetylglucosamine 2-epimerase